jgi:hypothetical protein
MNYIAILALTAMSTFTLTKGALKSLEKYSFVSKKTQENDNSSILSLS